MLKGIARRIAQFMTSTTDNANHASEGLGTGTTNADVAYAAMRDAYLPSNVSAPF
jgi:hypothetical protein